jgi:hypothetical protein
MRLATVAPKISGRTAAAGLAFAKVAFDHSGFS